MSVIQFTTVTNPESVLYQEFITVAQEPSHVHLVDMPFRLTSTWQDQGCELGLWRKDHTLLAWAVFQPPWRNLDYAICRSERGSTLEREVLAWGKDQMLAYAKRTGKGFSGSVEVFAETPHIERIIAQFHEFGFDEHHENTLRFELNLRQTFPPYRLPEGYVVRPLNDETEVHEYVHLVDAVFAPPWMTRSWRKRMREHPAYLRELDLVVVNPENICVGFCSSWRWQGIGQIEPLGVHPDCRGMGVGTALELAIIEAMQNRGIRLLYVDHGSSNKKAIALSQKNGFRQCHTIRKFSVECLPH